MKKSWVNQNKTTNQNKMFSLFSTTIVTNHIEKIDYSKIPLALEYPIRVKQFWLKHPETACLIIFLLILFILWKKPKNK